LSSSSNPNLQNSKRASKQARLLLSLLNGGDGGDGGEISSFFLGLSFDASSWQNKKSTVVIRPMI
jgi:hypothetical protein